MYSELSNLGISAIRRVTDLWRGAKADSLIDYTQVARVEPIVLIDADCLYLDMLPEVQQSLLSIFAGYYLQAVALSATVGRVEVRKHLDKLNPNRNPVDSGAHAGGEWLLATESYKFRLPVPNEGRRLALESNGNGNGNGGGGGNPYIHEKEQREREAHEWKRDQNDRGWLDNARAGRDEGRSDRKLDLDHSNYMLKRAEHESDQDYKARQDEFQREKFNFDRTTIEAKGKLDQAKFDKDVADTQRTYELNREKFGHEKAMSIAMKELQEKGLQLNREKFEYEKDTSSFGFGKDTFSTLKELANLSVGKQFAVEITDGGHTASIPVSIRLMASSMPTANLVHILSLGSQDKTVKERYHKWKSGRLEFIKDLVLCQDLIDAHRKNLMEDTDGIYTNLVKRSRNNGLATLASGNPSIATASNMVIMSSDSAAKLELEVNGKLDDFKTREKIFKETYLMIVVVIDKQWERVTFYHRGMHERTEAGMRDLKAANKGNGPDVSEILKAYQVGHSPSL